MTDSRQNPPFKYSELIDRSLEYLILSLLVLTALMFYQRAEGSFLTPKACFFQLGISLGLALWAARTALSARISICRTPLNLPLFFFLMLAVSSAWMAPYPALSRSELTYLALALVFYFIIPEIIRGKDQIRRILFVLIGLSGLVALYGILQYYQIDFIHDWIGRKHMFSTLGNPNFMAAYLICILPVSLIMVWTERKLEALLSCLSFFLACWALFLSQTRAAWTGAFFSFVFMALLFALKDRGFVKARKKAFLLIPAALLAITVLFVGLNLVRQQTEATAAMVDRIKTSPHDPFREFVWKAAWRMFQDHPLLGVGLGHFRVFYPDYQASLLSEQEAPAFIIGTYVRRAHNEYLQTAAELGLPGLLLMLWLVAALIRHGLGIYKKIGDLEGRMVAAGIFSGCLALLVNAFFSFPFHLASSGTVFICLAALITSTGRAYGAPLLRRETDLPFLRSKIFSRAVILLFLALSIFLSAGAVSRFASDIYLKQGYAMVNESTQLDQAEAILLRGIRLNPEEGKLFFALGSARHKKGDSVRAVRDLTRALETFRDVNVMQSLGTAYMINGERDKAVDMWRKAAAVRPDGTDALICLGVAYLETGQIDQAEKFLRQAVIYHPDAVESLYLLGHVLILQNRPYKAVESWKTVAKLERNQDRMNKLHLLGLASLRKAGFLEAVLASWPRALKLEPENSPLKEMADRFQQLAEAGHFNGRNP